MSRWLQRGSHIEGAEQYELFAKNPSGEAGVQNLDCPGSDLTHPQSQGQWQGQLRNPGHQFLTLKRHTAALPSSTTLKV